MVILTSGICAFVTFMVYLQSGYERDYAAKLTATITEVGDVQREVLSRRGFRAHSTYVEKYYQDIVIAYEKDGELLETYCQRVMTDRSEGYKAGDEITCYVDDEGQVAFYYNVRDKLYLTIVSALICVGAILLYTRIDRKRDRS